MTEMRLTKHPILDFKRKNRITFDYEGQTIEAYEGEPIAAALHAAGIMTLSDSLRFHRPRGLFCAIGKCASCVMEVNGIPNIRTCIVPALAGMKVVRQSKTKIAPVPFDGPGRFKEPPTLETDLAIIGGGPAGLSAAVYASRFGIKPLILEENFLMGGQLIKQTHKFFGSRSHHASVRGMDIANLLLREAEDRNVDMWTSASVIGLYKGNVLGVVYRDRYYKIKAKTILVAAGAAEKMISFPGNDLPGVFGAGAIQTLMNVYGITPGKRVLMVGAGNIGVIVGYQLLQAGIEVVAVAEALPRVGAYMVHSAKLQRLGVPIHTAHTIKKVWGDGKVEGAEIVQVDKNWQPVPGTEKIFELDTVGLAVGLSPSVEVLQQGNAQLSYIPELGGYVALHNEHMETSLPGVFVAGDAAGIEEASAAMMEGRIAGLTAAELVRGKSKELDDERELNKQELADLRNGPFGEKTNIGNEKLYKEAKQNGLR